MHRADPTRLDTTTRRSPAISLQRGDALIVVDVQNDFLPGGALGVTDGAAVIPLLNRCIQSFTALDLPVLATRDRHPAEHCPFSAQGGPWPPHCVRGTAGAEFAARLELPDSARLLAKARDADRDSYSGCGASDLAAQLRASRCEGLFIGGLATDYCVLNSVLDGLREGFAIFLLEDAVRAVNVRPGDGRAAIAAAVRDLASQIDGLGVRPSRAPCARDRTATRPRACASTGRDAPRRSVR